MDAMADRRIHVFVCDRQPLVCEGVIAILEREPDFSITGAATSSEEAIAAVRQQRPTVVVVGHDPPVFDGIGLTRELVRLGLGDPACVLLLEAASMDGMLVRALQGGARGVLCKERAPAMLASTVRSLSAGSVVVGPPGAARLVSQLSGAGEPELAHIAHSRLSGRELQVLELVATGLNNREIAASLSLSVATVKSHLHSLCRKLGLRDRIQAVILAYETGIVRPSGGGQLGGRTRTGEGAPGS